MTVNVLRDLGLVSLIIIANLESGVSNWLCTLLLVPLNEVLQVLHFVLCT